MNKNKEKQKDKYATTIVFDKDLELYLKNIQIILLLERIKNGLKVEKTTRVEYLNTLVRRDMLSFLKIHNISSIEEYFEKNNIKGDDYYE